MSDEIMNLSINVDKIDKTKLYAGKKGNYLDVALIPTPNNQYGDTHMIVQSISKEERDAGGRGNILGNVKAKRPKEEWAEKVQEEQAKNPELAKAIDETDSSQMPF